MEGLNTIFTFSFGVPAIFSLLIYFERIKLMGNLAKLQKQVECCRGSPSLEEFIAATDPPPSPPK
jgi:hypothetical protein